MSNYHYLQKEFNGLPVGTPLVHTSKPGFILAAERMMGKNVSPTAAYHLPGKKSKMDIFVIPLFGGYVNNVHPQDKSIVGPFVRGVVEQTSDKLPGNIRAKIFLVKDYPFINATVCFNTETTGDVVTVVGEDDFKDCCLDLDALIDEAKNLIVD